jgi:3-hydroxyisobutyrate dehydrogenase-like beta-hydroxyacid dehydrogenase
VATMDYGFIGVGRMGAHMARRLAQAGYSLAVYDSSLAAVEAAVAHGARATASVAEMADTAETIFLSLPTPEIIEQVALGEGGIAQGRRVKRVIDCSTTGPRTARAVAAGLAARGITYMDAPVSGGIAGARDGKVAVMVAAPRAQFEQVEAALGVIGKVFFVGEEAGQGQVMKLANNMLSLAALALSSEAMVMGVKAGLDPRQMLDAINHGSGRNSATQDKFPRSVLPGTFDFGFSIGLSHKDVRLCLQEADALGVPMIAGAAVLQLIAITEARFGPDADFTTIARVVEEWAGVEVRG